MDCFGLNKLIELTYLNYGLAMTKSLQVVCVSTSKPLRHCEDCLRAVQIGWLLMASRSKLKPQTDW